MDRVHSLMKLLLNCFQEEIGNAIELNVTYISQTNDITYNNRQSYSHNVPQAVQQVECLCDQATHFRQHGTVSTKQVFQNTAARCNAQMKISSARPTTRILLTGFGS